MTVRITVSNGRYIMSTRKLQKCDSILIEGKRWFDRTWGNTYCSARISINGELVKVIPYTYGYGNYYEQMSMEWLVSAGYLDDRGIYSNQDKGIIIYSTVSDGLKRELDKKEYTRESVA